MLYSSKTPPLCHWRQPHSSSDNTPEAEAAQEEEIAQHELTANWNIDSRQDVCVEIGSAKPGELWHVGPSVADATTLATIDDNEVLRTQWVNLGSLRRKLESDKSTVGTMCVDSLSQSPCCNFLTATAGFAAAPVLPWNRVKLLASGQTLYWMQQ